MHVEHVREFEDGSAEFRFDMTDEEKNMLLIYGLKCAIIAGIEEAKKWLPPESETESQSTETSQGE